MRPANLGFLPLGASELWEGNMKMKERLKSIPLWASVLALFHLVMKHWAALDLPGWADISSEIVAILAILFGTANNPTDRKHF